MELSYSIQSLLIFTSIDFCFYFWRVTFFVYLCKLYWFNPLNAELNPICHMLTLLGAHHILHVSRIRVKLIRTNNAFRNSLFPFISLLWQVHQMCFFLSVFMYVFSFVVCYWIQFYTCIFRAVSLLGLVVVVSSTLIMKNCTEVQLLLLKSRATLLLLQNS